MALFNYTEEAARSMAAVKYKNKREYLDFYAEAAAEKLRQYENREEWQFDGLVPVPVHPARKRKRGFNQAEEIAQTLGELTGIPCDNTLLQRIKATPQQTTLSAGQRRRNLRGAFRIRPHHYRHVALLDDVVTTGATAESLARLLIKAGARRVDVYCLARTPKPGA